MLTDFLCWEFPPPAPQKKPHTRAVQSKRTIVESLLGKFDESKKPSIFHYWTTVWSLCNPLWESNSMLIKKQRNMFKKTLMESTHDKHIIPCIVIWWRNLLPTKTWICTHSAHWKKIWEMIHGSHASTAELLRASPYPVCSLVILASMGAKITIHEQYFSAFLWVLSDNS